MEFCSADNSRRQFPRCARTVVLLPCANQCCARELKSIMASTVNPIDLVTAVRTCSREHWRNAGKWLAFTVGCGFLPIIIGLLLVWGLSTKSFNWYDFVVHGEFVIYSATLVAASTRLISKDTET